MGEESVVGEVDGYSEGVSGCGEGKEDGPDGMGVRRKYEEIELGCLCVLIILLHTCI